MIELRHLSVRSGSFQLSDLSLTIETGEYAVLLGPTGAGKTTLLEALCGLRTVTSGEVLLDGVNVTSFPPGARSIGYVPQDLCLFPTLSVRQHLEFAPRLRQWPAAQREARVRELADVLGIAPLLDRPPAGLSGGEAQRVAIGRAVAFAPRILLLDEPLSALDPQTRNAIQSMLAELHQTTRMTVLHVTHRLEEVAPMAQRVIILESGKLVDVGAPDAAGTSTSSYPAEGP